MAFWQTRKSNEFEIRGKFIYLRHMRMTKAMIVFMLFFYAGSLGIFPHSRQNNAQTDTDKLREILKKTGEYCEQLKKVVFDFVCHENIREKIFLYDTKTINLITELKFKRPKTTTYLYDYQIHGLFRSRQLQIFYC